MHLRAHRDGFSLIEATVAVAVLGMACIAVSAVLSTVLSAERTLQARRHLETVLAAEGERLRALPYYRRANGPDQPASPDSLLGEVFPHASPDRNVPAAYYADGSGAAVAGTFVSDTLTEGFTVSRASRFVVASGTGVTPVPVASLSSWAIWSPALPPAGCIEIELQASWRGLVVSRRLVIGTVRPSVASSLAALEGRRHVS
jgi:type II secretory pathway pseudopilin PulG